jgi:IS5 family transposase
MSRRRIGQETFGFGDSRGRQSSLDELTKLIDWTCIEARLVDISSSAKGEPAWPPLALFKALLLSVWYDLSDVKLAEALDDRASFRRFCGFSGNQATPERTAFVRFRKGLSVCALDKSLFDEITGQLKARAIKVKTGTLVDATIIVSASKEDDEGHWVKHKGKPAVHSFKAHVGADADTALVEEVAITPASRSTGFVRIEKIFGTWKRCYGLRRMRWRGLAKASIQVRLTAIAYNLNRTLNIITAAAA